MLAPDRVSQDEQLTNLKRKSYLRSDSVISYPRASVTPKRVKNNQTSHENQVVSRSPKVKVPFWLKCFNFIGTTSTGLSIMTVMACLAVYGLTVSAPSEWTQKYRDLQELQQRERQFTFSNEVLKNQLAEESGRSDSGLVSPDLSHSPVFLPKTDVEMVKPEETDISSPKRIQPIFPIAY
ncbi:hypothetical protein Cyast_0703 [Cyanobacterium stanieri PCC 7202]|uniref:Cell division protein FtsL n=1 Tax=Cyanobacterium stanieri (strain ATCC 29140 / PCC 7202) TaxID=292563 RepID=K9YKS3_CYASC|nr:hypothetical protein Cyast_0703 [Cyanobacterium stanieri PCC 7202]